MPSDKAGSAFGYAKISGWKDPAQSRRIDRSVILSTTYKTFIFFHNVFGMFSHRFRTLDPRLRSSCDQAVHRDTRLPRLSGA